MMANSDSKSAIGDVNAQRKPRILLGCCGSVAAMKFGLVFNAFLEWAEVRAVVTETSLQFLVHEKVESLFAHRHDIYKDEFEWKNWKKIGDSVLHIELANWADIMVIAPLSAHTLAKVINHNNSYFLLSYDKQCCQGYISSFFQIVLRF